jgi:hypothetical protein
MRSPIDRPSFQLLKFQPRTSERAVSPQVVSPVMTPSRGVGRVAVKFVRLHTRSPHCAAVIERMIDDMLSQFGGAA